MISLVYASLATQPFSQEELADLLTVCRLNNRRLDVTGILLHNEGRFLQVLEGDEDVIRALYDKIARDPRHRGASVVLRQRITEREYPEWSMGFKAESPELAALPGFDRFFDHAPGSSELDEQVGVVKGMLEQLRSTFL